MTEWKLSEFCLFDGRTVRYGISGHGQPVVVVHGTPWSSFNLRHIIGALYRYFTVYYYDMIGYGQTEKRLFTGRSHRRILVSRMRCDPCMPGFPGRF